MLSRIDQIGCVPRERERLLQEDDLGTEPNEGDQMQLPPFPGQRKKKSTSVLRDRHFSMWIGPGSSLIRIAELAEDCLRRAYDEQIAKFSGDERGVAASVRLGESLALESEITGNRGRLKRSGELRTLLAEVDVREIETLYIGNGLGRYMSLEIGVQKPSISIEFDLGISNSYERQAVELKVAGSDRQWVAGSFDLLSAELAKGSLWWSFVARPWFAIVLWIVSWLGIAGIAFNLLKLDSDNALLLILPISVVIGWGSAWVGTSRLAKRIFPSFEVLETGSAGHVRASFAAVMSVGGFLLALVGLILAVR